MKLTLAEVLAEHWQRYARKHRRVLCAAHYRAVRCVLACRSAELGGRLYCCESCRKKHFAYHSCNHRSCPQCGALAQQIWTSKQEARLLPVAYFMVTFTVPAELRSLCKKHPALLYDLLLKQSAQALKEVIFTKTKGVTGFTSVLHTWGRQLQHHPHVHCVVPAAALQQQKGELVESKGAEHFLVHYKPLSARFRNLMRLALTHSGLELSEPQRRSLSVEKAWNVQLQQVGRGSTALRYLARYVKRSGFTNKRLIGYTADRQHVLLRWINSANGKQGVLRLSVQEFIRRWLLHVLPKGFARVRHYGYLSSAAKKTFLELRALLGVMGQLVVSLPELSALSCPHCEGRLRWLCEIPRSSSPRGPPRAV